MALSGVFYKNAASGYRIQVEWSATQNVGNNTSTITQKLYWVSLNSYSTINSSTTKSGYQNINGGTDTTFSGTGLADLNGNQKKLLHTLQETVSHNSDGTKSVLLEASFSPNITLSSGYVGTVTASSTVTLNTIPRSSTLTDKPDFKAGGNLSVGISRASSSFTHTVKLYVAGSDGVYDLIEQMTGQTTSAYFNFSLADDELIFKQLAGASYRSSKIELLTYSGSTQVGSTETTYGTVSSPNASTIDSSSRANFNIGDDVYVGIEREDPNFTHTLKYYVNNTLIKTTTDVGFSDTWKPTDAEKTNMYNQAKNSNSVGTKIELITYQGSTQVRTSTSITGTAKVTNSNPSFSGNYTYKDTNTTTSGLTQNDQLMIQSKSTLQVQIPSTAFATGVNGASIVQYVATINGVSKSVTTPFTSPIVFDMGVVNAPTNVTLTVKAVDSRGNSTSAQKTITMVPYANPVVNTSVTRANSFENTTTLKLSGSISSVSGKNSVQATEYRYRENVSGSSFNAWTPITRTTSGNTYQGDNVTFDFDNTKSYIFEIRTSDLLGTTTVTRTVAVGKPIFFIDTLKKSLGINMFPTLSAALEIEGVIKTYSSLGSITLGGRDIKIHEKRAMVGLNDADGNELLINYNKDFANGTRVPGPFHVETNDDASGSNNAGLMVGSASGGNIKFDGNEISAYTGSSPAQIFINPDGGKVNFHFTKNPSLVISDGWIENMDYIYPSLQNGWSNYSSSVGGFQRAAYWKDKNGTVFVVGMIRYGTTSTTSGTVLFTLPAGYRPASEHTFTCATSSTSNPARIDVNPDGTIQGHGNLNTQWTSLAGIAFKAEK